MKSEDEDPRRANLILEGKDVILENKSIAVKSENVVLSHVNLALKGETIQSKVVLVKHVKRMNLVLEDQDEALQSEDVVKHLNLVLQGKDEVLQHEDVVVKRPNQGKDEAPQSEDVVVKHGHMVLQSEDMVCKNDLQVFMAGLQRLGGGKNK